MSRESQLLEGNEVKIGKQITLPISKAIEISFRGMKVRFWRSLITMSGIILAIAFMVSVGAGSAIVNGLWTQSAHRVIVEIKSEPYELIVKDGKRQRKVLLHRQRAIFNTVGEVLRRKGLKEPDKGFGSSSSSLSDSRTKSETGEVSAASREASDADKAAAARIKAAESASRRETWLVILSLCVAVVGIVNSMLMSVTERFREIGTMKCLGALDSFVIKLFLLESSFVGTVGTLIGVVIGLLLTSIFGLISFWVVSGYMLPGLNWGSVGLNVLWATAAGIILSILGAIYPAMVAARMDPVVAMRADN
jgi:putative ABC transport system permease protein